jgi:hypothetical protein
MGKKDYSGRETGKIPGMILENQPPQFVEVDFEALLEVRDELRLVIFDLFFRLLVSSPRA